MVGGVLGATELEASSIGITDLTLEMCDIPEIRDIIVRHARKVTDIRIKAGVRILHLHVPASLVLDVSGTHQSHTHTAIQKPLLFVRDDHSE